MSDGQFLKMVDYACRRLTSCEGEMHEWRNEMARARRESERDLSDRVAGREAMIFLKSNESADIVASAAEFIVARLSEDVFGTEPWFMVAPERTQAPVGQEAPDTVLATEIDEHARWKIRNIGWKTAGRTALKTAVDLGTAIMKTTWRRKVETYKRYANVLVHAANPMEAVATAAGDYIFDSDEMVEQVGVEGAAGIMWGPEEDAETRGQGDAEMGAPAAGGMGGMGGMGAEMGNTGGTPVPLLRRTVAAKDVNVVVDLEGAHKFERYLIDETAVRYDAAFTELVDDRNFVAPLSANRLEDVDFCAHVYDRRLSDIRAMLPKGDPKSQELLKQIKGETISRKEPARANERSSGDEDNPWVRVAECYFDYDPLEDGNTVRVYLVVLPATTTGIDMGCDYLANVIPEGEYPFDPVIIMKKKGKWVGTGMYEAYRRVGQAVDRNFNAMIYRNDMHANPIKCIHEDALEEEPEDLHIGPDTTFTLKPNKTLKDFIEFGVLPDLDQQTFEIVKFSMNLFQNRVGVSSAAQGSTAELPQINTATGTNAVLASGATLGSELLEQVRGEIGQGGLINHLDKTIRLIYTRQDKAETFAYGEGQFRKIVELTPEKVRNMSMHVHLLLTRFKQKQDVDNAAASIAAIVGANVGYIQVPEQEKEAVRPLFVQLLKGRGYDNADSIVRKAILPVAPMGMPGQGEPQMTQMGADGGMGPEGGIDSRGGAEAQRGGV